MCLNETKQYNVRNELLDITIINIVRNLEKIGTTEKLSASGLYVSVAGRKHNTKKNIRFLRDSN